MFKKRDKVIVRHPYIYGKKTFKAVVISNPSYVIYPKGINSSITEDILEVEVVMLSGPKFGEIRYFHSNYVTLDTTSQLG